MRPEFDGLVSRGNLFAIAGASLSLVAGLSCLITLITKSIDRVRVITIVAVIPFILIGLFYQLWSQNERFKAWNEQRQVWSLMFDTVPGLKDESEVVIIIPGYNQLSQFQVIPFMGNWEAEAALKTLYNNPTLRAIYLFPDRPPDKRYNFLDDGSDWSKIVFVYYDPAKPSLEIVENPGDKLLLPFRVTGYDPGKRIINQSLNSLTYRWLVK